MKDYLICLAARLSDLPLRDLSRRGFRKLTETLRRDHETLEIIRRDLIDNFFAPELKKPGLLYINVGRRRIEKIEDLEGISTLDLLRTKADWVPF